MSGIRANSAANGTRAGGFTTLELLTVVAIMAVLASLATLELVQWRNRHNSARGSRGAYDALRMARSRAMSTGLQHMVRFEPVAGRYRVLRGDRAYRTPASGWTTVVQDWVTMAGGVSMTSGVDGTSRDTVDAQFNADGTAHLETPSGTPLVAPRNSITISLGGRASTVVVSTCGRISLD